MITMTETALNRAKEIQEEISMLQGALSQTSRENIFSIDRNSCTYGRLGTPFLAELDVFLKTHATTAITKRIKVLESEFKSL